MAEMLSDGKPVAKKTGHDGSVEPGQVCPNCSRRMPHPKKADTPKSAVTSYRVPVDEAEAHRETLQVAAQYIGAFERPYWQWQTYAIGLALILQDDSLQGFAQRGSA